MPPRPTNPPTARLEALHERIAILRFLDPACGCGNFLVITYRELRALELEILLELHRNELSETQHEFSFDVTKLSKVDVDQMHGIEIEEFPAKITEVALWLADHQANIALSETFGQLYRRIPLKKSPHIVCANALRTDWKTVLPPEQCSYVLGNPPFVGKHYQNAEQKADMGVVFGEFDNNGDVDFVVSWFVKAADYIRGTTIRCALVSTKNIVQGEQLPII
jgi:type II restriction/modification system DNA methylase subunit YeeA